MKTKIISWLEEMKISGASILEHSVHGWCVDVKGDVLLVNQDLNELLFQFGEVSGFFNISENNLIDLAHCPHTVGDSFSCNQGILQSLKGAPQRVGGDFQVIENQIVSLEYSPLEVGGSFLCWNNRITSLREIEHCKIGDTLNCSKNLLTSLLYTPEAHHYNFGMNKLVDLVGAPEMVGGTFIVYHNDITSLKGSPREVLGSFSCSHNRIQNLRHGPERVEREYLCNNNRIESFEFLPDHVGKRFNCNNNSLIEKYSQLNFLQIKALLEKEQLREEIQTVKQNMVHKL